MILRSWLGLKKKLFVLGLDSIRTAILNWHFLRIDTQEMHIPSAISIHGTDLRGLIP